MKRLFGYSRGQTMVAIALGLATLLGCVSMATDVAVMYYNWANMQKAADAAVLAGAHYLPDTIDTAKTVAQTYAQNNGLALSEIQCGSPAAVCVTLANSNTEITLTAKRTVPYYFGKVLGLTSQLIQVAATAQIPTSVSCVGAGCSMPTGSSQPGSGASDSGGSECANLAQCQLIPIGLDYTTTFLTGVSVTFNQAQVGAGNWDILALGGTGGANARTNLANGYSGPVSIGDWITTEPGKKKGPITQGFNDRIDQANSCCASQTFSNHSINNPRLVVIPMVNWGSINGRDQVQVMAFAHVWLDSVSNGQITAHFVEDYIPDAYVSPWAPYKGGRGNPILIR